MTSYKLHYFDARGAGELTRYLFAVAGKEFDDVRITREQWPSVKPTTPFGQMPVLEVDGKKLAQSGSMARFIAREFGLAGKNSWEQALVDQYMELARDLFQEIMKARFEQDETKKAELMKNIADVVFPKFLALFQKALDQNGGKYLVGNGITLGDLALIHVLDTALMKNPNLLNDFPRLKAHRQFVTGTPRLAAYIKKRKVTEM